MDELAREIADELGIEAGMISVVLVTPTQVQVTIAGETLTAAQVIASQLVQLINNGETDSDDSGSMKRLLRKAIDAHIRKDDDHSTTSNSNDDVNTASRSMMMMMLHCNNHNFIHIASLIMVMMMMMMMVMEKQ